MIDKLNTKGYNFHMVSVDHWTMDDNSGTIAEGSFAAVLVFAVQRGFAMKELELGVEMMLAKGDNSVHFGIKKTPIYTSLFLERKKT